MKLNKKHSSLAYHKTRWDVVAGIVIVGWINTNYNIADAFTKRLSAGKRDFLLVNGCIDVMRYTIGIHKLRGPNGWNLSKGYFDNHS